MRKISSALRKRCQAAEAAMRRRLGHPVADVFDLLRFMTDRTRDHDFAGESFVLYYFVKEMWREAREALYYGNELYEIRKRNDIGRDWLALPFVSDEERYELIKKWLKILEEAAKRNKYKDNIFYISFNFYLRLKPFAPKELDFASLLARAIAGWKGRSEEWRGKLEQPPTPENHGEEMCWAFGPFSNYLLLLLCSGQLDAVETELAPYAEWLEWTRRNRTRARYLSYAWGENRVADPRFLIPALQCWLAACRQPGRRAALAGEALKYFDKWLNEDIKDWHGAPDIPGSALLSMVMRIDLGLDLENCREFARYFKPYLTVFPHIADKVAALNVEYEPPSGLMPREEIARLRRQYLLEIGRDPDTGETVFMYHDRN